MTARFELIYVVCTGILYTAGGQYIREGTLDECGNDYPGVVIKVMEDYG